MPDMQRLERALRNAHAAGDESAARRLAQEIQSQRSQATPAGAQGWQNTYASQGASGVNEGIARTLGAPVDLVNAGIGLGMAGVNRIAGTNFQPSEEPFLGSRQIEGAMGQSGMIGPESDDPSHQFVRRVGEEVGATALPGGAVASRAARPVAVAAAEAGYALGGGVGGATAQQIAPDNITAEVAGTLAGSMTPWAASTAVQRQAANRARREQVPTRQDLEARAGELYDAAERTGRTATQQETQALDDAIRSIAQREGLISPTGRIDASYPRLRSIIRTLDDYAEGAMAPAQMMSVRKSLQNAAGSNDRAERRLGSIMLGEFDRFADNLAPQLPEARALWARARRAEQLETMREVAEAGASQYSQSGMENALRVQYRQMDRRIGRGQERGFSPQEIEAIQRVNRGTPASNLARNIGRGAPTGVGGYMASAVAPSIIGTMLGGPVGGVALPGVAMAATGAARRSASRSTERHAELAEILVRSGMPVEQVRHLTPEQERVAMALLAAQSGVAIEE